MNDKAVEGIAEALKEQGAAYPNAGAILVVDALKAAGIALVELQSVDGLRFTYEDGTHYTPDELRYFAGEALAAAATG